jgi:DNA-binding response OmpR family regulator
MIMRILIVEDEAIIALCIGLTLQQAGHEVMGPAGRLEACLQLAEHEVPELALIDISLENGGSGIDVARALLKRWDVRSIYVSAQTAQARENGDVALGCLHKPFATRSLLETIEVAEILRQGALPLRLPEGLQLFTPSKRTGLAVCYPPPWPQIPSAPHPQRR